MSWFDTTSLTSIAKTAFREAQKTIDRALDIKEIETAETIEADSDIDTNVSVSSTIVSGHTFAVTTLQPVKSLLSTPVGSALWGAIKGLPSTEKEEPSSEDDPSSEVKETSPISLQPIAIQVISKPSSSELKTLQKAEWGWGWESQLQNSIESLKLPPIVTANEWSDVKLDEESESVQLVGEASESQVEDVKTDDQNRSALSLQLVSENLRLGSELETPASIVTLGSELCTPRSPSSVEIIDSRTPSQSEIWDNAGRRDLSVLSSNSSSLTVISPENEPGCSVAEVDENQVVPSNSRLSNTEIPDDQCQGSVTCSDSRSETTVSSTESFVKFEDQSKEANGRDTSPLSSERSDAMKLRSAFNSGHTSGDELETAASSDIEVISSPGSRAPSSPNRCLIEHGMGDSSSHLSVTPARMNSSKCHRRQLSEGSSGGSDDSLASEVEKLMKRISEKNRILEARETKLLELSRINANLQEENSRVTSKLEETENVRRSETEAASRLLEDLTRRLSHMEQKCQQAVSEKEIMHRKVETLNQDLSCRIPAEDVEALLTEKDQIIVELRAEGDKLSKQHLQHSNAIKKLRAKEKEDEKVLKVQKEKLEELQKESDRLKKSLSAKEDIERSQIDAVRQLTDTNKVAEKELTTLRSRCSEAESQLSSLRDAVEFAQRELEALEQRNVELESETAKRTLSKEMSVRQELQLALENAQKSAREEKSMLLARIEDLKSSLLEAEFQIKSRNEQHRTEINSLMERLSQLETSQEDSSHSITEATQPLLRQIESLHQSISAFRERGERVERSLTERLKNADSEVENKVQSEKRLKADMESLKAEIDRLRNDLENVSAERTNLLSELRHEKTKVERETTEANNARQAVDNEIQYLRSEVENLREAVDLEKASCEQEREKSKNLQEQLTEREKSIAVLLSQGHTVSRHSELYHSTSFHSRTSSPTPSLGRISLSEDSQEAHTKDPWGHEDDVFESGMATPVARQSTVYDVARSGFGAATLLETLESQLKLKEGEIIQLQFELANQERKRSALANEVVRLTTENENLHDRFAQIEQLRPEFEELQMKYDALLTMYGEKVEEAEELRMDLVDVKEAYKIQIDHLTQS